MAKKQLSEQELIELDRELKQYQYQTTVYYPHEEVLTVTDTIGWLIDKGAMSSRNCVRATVSTSVDGRETVDTTLFNELYEKVQQWNAWKGRKEYGKQQRDKEYEQIAQQMYNNVSTN